MKIGDIIKDLRLNSNLTQQIVAENLEISRSVLSQYENNLVEPTAYVVAKFAKYFDVSTDYLLGLEDDFGARSPAPTHTPALTAEESKIFEQYRRLPEQLRKLIRQQLDVYSSPEELLSKSDKKV